MGSVSREQVDDLRCFTISSKMLLSISSKNRHSHVFFKLRSNPCDLCITRRCANLLSDIIDLLRKEGSELVAFAVREHFTGNLTWGVCQPLNSSKKSASVV